MDAQRRQSAAHPPENPRPMIPATRHPEWFCVRTQTKREHIAAGHLRELEGVEVFCPRLRYRKATRRGKIWWVEPLFPGYLLAKFDLAEMERAVTFCQGVRGLVRFGSEIPPVPDSFVESLRQEVRNRSGGRGGIVFRLAGDRGRRRGGDRPRPAPRHARHHRFRRPGRRTRQNPARIPRPTPRHRCGPVLHPSARDGPLPETPCLPT